MNFAAPGESLRLFVAIPLSAEWIEALSPIAKRNEDIPGLRWAAVANLHITVCFIGDVDSGRMPEVAERITAASQRVKSFRIGFEAIRPAPDPRRPRMVWAVFARHARFNDIVAGLARELRPFMAEQTERAEAVAHVTLARMKKPITASALDLRFPSHPADLLVDRIELWESSLLPQGAIYRKIQEFRLPA